MRTLLVVALLALSVVPALPTAAADACTGDPGVAGVCDSPGYYECYQVWVLGRDPPALNFCFA